MRVFVALHLPDAVATALEPVQEALPFGRLVEPESLHLTLAFLGERPVAEVEAAHEALETVRGAAFDLQLQGLGAFGEVVWAGLRDPAPVAALQARVLSRLRAAGIEIERRRFRPHVTIARLSKSEAAESERLARFLATWSAFPAPVFRVTGFGLWRSTLRPDGAVYDVLASYPLAAP